MVGDITDVLPKGGIRGVLDILEMILGVRRELANKEWLHCGVCFHKVYTRGIYLLLSLGSRPGPEVMERAGRSSSKHKWKAISSDFCPAQCTPTHALQAGTCWGKAGVYNKQSQSGRQILKHQAA